MTDDHVPQDQVQPQAPAPSLEQHMAMMDTHLALSRHNTTMMAAILALKAVVDANEAVLDDLMGMRGMGGAGKPSQKPADGVSAPPAV
jgi:hypothetical protein